MNKRSDGRVDELANFARSCTTEATIKISFRHVEITLARNDNYTLSQVYLLSHLNVSLFALFFNQIVFFLGCNT